MSINIFDTYSMVKKITFINKSGKQIYCPKLVKGHIQQELLVRGLEYDVRLQHQARSFTKIAQLKTLVKIEQKFFRETIKNLSMKRAEITWAEKKFFLGELGSTWSFQKFRLMLSVNSTYYRVKVWRCIFVRIAMKVNNFHRVFLTSFWGECGESR